MPAKQARNRVDCIRHRYSGDAIYATMHNVLVLKIVPMLRLYYVLSVPVLHLEYQKNFDDQIEDHETR